VVVSSISVPHSSNIEDDIACERVLFIGTQFSILYTSMYSPAGCLSVPLPSDTDSWSCIPVPSSKVCCTSGNVFEVPQVLSSNHRTLIETRDQRVVGPGITRSTCLLALATAQPLRGI
jgi:hypothetical protein